MPAFETGFAAAPAARGKVFDQAPGESAHPAAPGEDFDRVMQATLAPRASKPPGKSAWRAEKKSAPGNPSVNPPAGPAKSPDGKKNGSQLAAKSTAAATKPAADPTSPDPRTLSATSAGAEPLPAFLSLPAFSSGPWGGVPEASAKTAVADAAENIPPVAGPAGGSLPAANATARPAADATVSATAPIPRSASAALTAQKNPAPALPGATPGSSAPPTAAAEPEPAPAPHSALQPADAAAPPAAAEPSDPFAFAAWDNTLSPLPTDNALILPRTASQPENPATEPTSPATAAATQPATEPMASLATPASQLIAGGLAQILAAGAAGQPAAAAGRPPAPARQNSPKLAAPANPASDTSPKPAGERPAATSRDPDPAAGASAPAPASAAPAATDPAAGNAGTGVAMMSWPMKNPQETNKVAGPAVKVLPVAPNSVADEKNLPLSGPGPVRADIPAGANADFAPAAGDSHSLAATPAALSSMGLPSLTDTQMRGLERAHDMVVLHTMRLVESKSDELSVVIKPSVGTELSLALRQRGDGVEAQATLTRGDHEFLTQHWPELQQRLEQRGIKLAPLGSETGGDFASGEHSRFQQEQSPAEEAAQQASAFAEFAASGQSGGASARLAIHDGWESWA